MSCRKSEVVAQGDETLFGLPATEYGVRLCGTEDGVQTCLHIATVSWKRKSC